MKNLLSLKINGEEIPAPTNIPTEGLSGTGGKIIGFGLTLFLISAVLLAFGFLIYGGYNWIMSEGDKTKVESARKTIIFAIIGLILCFLSFFLVNILGAILNVNFFNLSL